MSEKLNPCFYGEEPVLSFDGADTWTVECKNHKWSKSDDSDVGIGADIAFYASGEEYEPNDEYKYIATKESIAKARLIVINEWNKHHPMCDRESLLNLADEMEKMDYLLKSAKTWFGLGEYVRRIREACGVVE